MVVAVVLEAEAPHGVDGAALEAEAVSVAAAEPLPAGEVDSEVAVAAGGRAVAPIAVDTEEGDYH